MRTRTGVAGTTCRAPLTGRGHCRSALSASPSRSVTVVPVITFSLSRTKWVGTLTFEQDNLVIFPEIHTEQSSHTRTMHTPTFDAEIIKKRKILLCVGECCLQITYNGQFNQRELERNRDISTTIKFDVYVALDVLREKCQRSRLMSALVALQDGDGRLSTATLRDAPKLAPTYNAHPCF